MNILVTGANGFVGRALIRSLKKTQHEIYALDLEYKKDYLPVVSKQFYVQDITREFSIDQSFDIVFHLAACNLTHVGKTHYQTYYDVNVQGTKNLIKSSKIKKFVFLSTTKVYKIKGKEIDELSPVSPLSSYEKSKLEAENICRQYFSYDDLTIFRSVNIVGEGQAEKAVIPIFFKNAMSGRPLEIIDSGKTKAQLLYIEDLVYAFMHILANNDVGYGIVNLAGEETIEIRELAEKIIRICDSKSKIICNKNEDIIYSNILTEKAKNVLGWQATVLIDEILIRYFNFCRTNE
jgi:nucleoside-diphosphate-sugar epimerase